MRVVDALQEVEEDRAIGCISCNGVATDATAPYCEHCHDYWANDAPLLAAVCEASN